METQNACGEDVRLDSNIGLDRADLDEAGIQIDSYGICQAGGSHLRMGSLGTHFCGVSRNGYQAPAGDLAGYKTLVSPKSEKGLPTDTDREKEVVLPPDSATPGSPAGEGAGTGDHTSQLPSGTYNTPANGIPDRPRTIAEPGAERGTTYKQDGNFVRRRTMLGYKPETPPKKQHRQSPTDRRTDHKWYVRNRNNVIRQVTKWYKKVRKNPTFKRLRQKARDYPNRHKRKTSPRSKSAEVHLLPSPLVFGFQGAEPGTWDVGLLVGLEPETYEVVYEMEGAAAQSNMAATEFLLSATFLSEEDMQKVLDLVDEHLGVEAYEDVGDAETLMKLALRGYKPTKTRRKKWRGTTKTKGRKYERRRKRSPKRKQYMKRYRQRRNKNPMVKRQRARRRRNPARWKKRGSVLTTPEIAFVFGPDLKLGYVHSVSPMTGMVTFSVAEPNVMQLQSLPVVVFLEVIVPLSEEDTDALFDLLEIEIGQDVYEDEVTIEDIRECAAMYGIDPDSSEFREGCFKLTGRAFHEMTADDRALVNGVLVTKMLGGGILNRSPEDDFIEDDGVEEEDEENFYYGRVDLPRDVSVKRVAHSFLLKMAWEGTNWQYDQEAPNAWDSMESVPDRPYQPSSPTHWRHQPQEKKTPAPGTSHHEHPSVDDAPASSAKAPGGSYVSEGGYIGKTAATMHDIIGRTDPGIQQRARKVRIKLKRADPGRGIWTFHARGSKGETYKVRVKGIKKGNTKSLAKVQLQVSCDCNFFRWQGPEHWAKANRFLYGRPQGTASKPDMKDPKGRHWACKHLVAALQLSRQYRVAHAGDCGWPSDAEVVPDYAPSVKRVAARWLSSIQSEVGVPHGSLSQQPDPDSM